MHVWQPRHYVLFRRCLSDHPFYVTWAELRRTFDRAFPHFSGQSFAGAMATLERRGLIEVMRGKDDRGTDGRWVWSTWAAAEAVALIEEGRP